MFGLEVRCIVVHKGSNRFVTPSFTFTLKGVQYNFSNGNPLTESTFKLCNMDERPMEMDSNGDLWSNCCVDVSTNVSVSFRVFRG